MDNSINPDAPRVCRHCNIENPRFNEWFAKAQQYVHMHEQGNVT